MVHTDSVGAAVFNLDVVEHETAVGLGAGLSGAGETAVCSAYQHQYTEVIRYIGACCAVDHLTSDSCRLLSQDSRANKGKERQRDSQDH